MCVFGRGKRRGWICNTFEANFAIKFGSLSSIALFADRFPSHNQQSKVHVFVVVVVAVVLISCKAQNLCKQFFKQKLRFSCLGARGEGGGRDRGDSRVEYLYCDFLLAGLARHVSCISLSLSLSLPFLSLQNLIFPRRFACLQYQHFFVNTHSEHKEEQVCL